MYPKKYETPICFFSFRNGAGWQLNEARVDTEKSNEWTAPWTHNCSKQLGPGLIGGKCSWAHDVDWRS